MLQATTKWELLVHSAPLLSQRQRHLFRTTPPLTRPLPTRLQPTKHQPTKLQPTRFTLPLIDDWLPKSRFQAPASAFQIPVNRVTGQPVQWPRRPKIFQIFCKSIGFNVCFTGQPVAAAYNPATTNIALAPSACPAVAGLPISQCAGQVKELCKMQFELFPYLSFARRRRKIAFFAGELLLVYWPG